MGNSVETNETEPDVLQRQEQKSIKLTRKWRERNCGTHTALTVSGKQATLQRKSSHERMANETFEELQGSEVIVDERQICSLMRGKGYSRSALTSGKGWQLKHPKERETRLQQMNTNQCERLKPPRREKQD